MIDKKEISKTKNKLSRRRKSMKVNNMTRLMVTCLWCCSILFAANPYKQKPVEYPNADKDATYQQDKKEATYKAIKSKKFDTCLCGIIRE